MAPWLSCLQSVSLFLMTSIHSEFDIVYLAFFQPYAYVMVGVFTFLEMLCDLLLDAYDGRLVFIQTPRFYIKSVFFVAFSACFPHVVLKWLDFFKVKRCHAYVPFSDGILEYICAASIIAYNFITLRPEWKCISRLHQKTSGTFPRILQKYIHQWDTKGNH
ncbi:Protein CBG04443 [Caenorhabditis briggsae]|uniref:Protein CBG04443 n=1 Tax=Caenorhabditis briggsae TaxID=6238 RepID=A8WXK4_CAEBR|nr:Protein CBG04443 [Caenorhabditis briggsae]CAP25141.1 Protein CBG04443 [Caenorhabditis briggsae]